MTFPPLAVTKYWAPVNDQLLSLIDLIPDDKLDWSPKPELFSLRKICDHIAQGRHTWMTRDVQDGEPPPSVIATEQTKEELKEQLQISWQRMERFLSDPEQLDATYIIRGGRMRRDGHWIAYHGMEHDIHHRADIFHYLALLGIDHGEIEAP